MDRLGIHVDGGEAPVHAQVDGDQDEGLREKVHFLGPSLDCVEANVHEAGVEEGREGVDRPELCLVSL